MDLHSKSRKDLQKAIFYVSNIFTVKKENSIYRHNYFVVQKMLFAPSFFNWSPQPSRNSEASILSQSWFPTSHGAVNSAVEQQVLDLICATLFVLCHGQRSKLLMSCNQIVNSGSAASYNKCSATEYTKESVDMEFDRSCKSGFS